MYPNIRAEMVRRGITQRQMVNKLAERGRKMSLSKFSSKMTGKQEFTFGEAVAIKQILQTELPLETLLRPREI